MDFEDQLDVRPPRFQLDDSDSDNEGVVDARSSTRTPISAPSVRSSLRSKPGQSCVVALGSAARIWAGGLPEDARPAGEASVGHDQVRL